MMIKKIFFASILMTTCSQNIIALPASLSSIVASAKTIKNPALVAGGVLAVATSAVSAAYCYWIKGYYKKQELLLNKERESIESKAKALQEKRALVEKNELLRNLELIEQCEKGVQHKNAGKLTAGREMPVVDIEKVLKAWTHEAESGTRLFIPEEIQCSLEAIAEEYSSERFNWEEIKKRLSAITNHQWYKNFQKKSDELEEEVASLNKSLPVLKETQEVQKTQLAAQHARSWPKLWCTMGLGYVAAFGLGLYGYLAPQKA